MRACLGVLTIVVMASGAQAQSLSYQSDREGTGETRREQVDRDQNGDRLGLNWLDLPSRMTHSKWSERTKPLFDEMDADGDSVLSEYDLQKLSPSEAEAWAERTVVELFSFWLPDYDAKLEEIRTDIQQQAGANKYLEETSGAFGSVVSSYEALKLDEASNANAYVKAEIAADGAKAVDTGSVAANARSWVQVAVPVSLTIYSPHGEQDFRLNAKVLAMAKFARNENDDHYALWQIKLSGR